MAESKKPRAFGAHSRDHDTPPPASTQWETSAELGKTMPLGSGAGQPLAGTGSGPSLGRGIELFVVDETQLPGGERRPWRAAEVWTKRRVYGLDSTFRCIEILERDTGRPELGHDMLGARLGGGRLRDKDTVRFSYPYPLPGMEAMFMKGRKHGYTSPVERMIVRVRVLHTSAHETLPTWEEIASRWSEPLPRAK